MSHILVFGEKPSVNKALAPAMAKAFPGREIFYLNVMPYLNPAMDYPQHLEFDDFPVISDPLFKTPSLDALLPMAVDGDKLIRLENLSAEKSNHIQHGWDQIVDVCDPDHSGAIGFTTIAKQWYGDGILDDPRVTAIKLVSMSDEYIDLAIAARSSFLSKHSESLSYGETKRFIDWNWNVNSQAILGETMRRAGVEEENPVISKYALQALYFIQEHPDMTEGNVIGQFSHWNGTGQYPKSSLGSAASYAAIVEQLIKLGLVSSYKKEGNANYLDVSETGKRFLGMLHDGARDQDLPARIEQWCKAGLEASRADIERYMRTLFGGQKESLQLNSPTSPRKLNRQ